MANKVQLKTAGDQEFKDNDPFAELTRIMGFDPRVQPTPSPDQDFEIDLEKELIHLLTRLHLEAVRQDSSARGSSE